MLVSLMPGYKSASCLFCKLIVQTVSSSAFITRYKAPCAIGNSLVMLHDSVMITEIVLSLAQNVILHTKRMHENL